MGLGLYHHLISVVGERSLIEYICIHKSPRFESVYAQLGVQMGNLQNSLNAIGGTIGVNACFIFIEWKFWTVEIAFVFSSLFRNVAVWWHIKNLTIIQLKFEMIRHQLVSSRQSKRSDGGGRVKGKQNPSSSNEWSDEDGKTPGFSSRPLRAFVQ